MIMIMIMSAFSLCTLCPVCREPRQCTPGMPVRSREVCASCIHKYGIRTKYGDLVHIHETCTFNGRDCYVNNVCCYAYESNNNIVVVSTLAIPKNKKTL